MPAIQTVRQRQFGEELQAIGKNLIELGLFLDDYDNIGYELSSPDPVQDELGINNIQEDSETYLLTGQVFLGLGLANPFWGRQSGPRGPYFQFPKSSDVFHFSLQWPDRWFRHMYRYAIRSSTFCGTSNYDENMIFGFPRTLSIFSQQM